MDIFLIRLLQFMLAIGLLVLLHEGGHFFFSKLFGVRDREMGRQSIQIQAQEQRHPVWCRLATSGRLLQDCRYDRREL